MSDESATEPTQPEAEATEAPTNPTEEATPVTSETDTPDIAAAADEAIEDQTTEAAGSADTSVTPEETPTGLPAEESVVATSEAAVPVAADEAAPSDEAMPRSSVGERPAITAPRDIGDVADDLSAEDFAAVIERTVFEFKEGDIVGGTVVRVDPDEVLVDIGFKAEGVIPLHELSIRNQVNPGEVVKEGEPIEALVLQMEDDQGRLVLSKKRAQYERAWGRIEKIMNEGGTVTGPVIEVVKGGLIVDIGLRGFLPASLVDLRRVRDLAPFIGETIEAKVIELDKNRNNVVLSRRASSRGSSSRAASSVPLGPRAW